MMLKIAGVALLALVLAACVQVVRNSGTEPLPVRPEGALRIATYNVHYINLRAEDGPWSVPDWERRKGPLQAAFEAMNADVIGFQEMESFGRGDTSGINLTRDFLLEQNPGYAVAAHGPAAEFPQTQPILYRADRLRLEDQGWFFFSETPDVIYSRTFDGSWPAFASWAEFTDLTTGKAFRVYNVHYEYKSGSNRLLSAALTRDRMRDWIENGGEAVLLGDLNARLGAQTLTTFDEIGLSFAPVSGATYHLNRGINLFGAIDHIATTGGFTLLSEPVVLRRKFEGEWPTDHYPVVADFTLE
ncbi:MAG: endonuclease/exonuclease/phosphatase family protein [Marivita sp.]|uniref:endonuclease/exonuclease/phosphatase family protein n=1 Tax=Marivita sp. TaxID=2003365 RepID=UPI003EF55FCA